jgi:hypothetical protein
VFVHSGWLCGGHNNQQPELSDETQIAISGTISETFEHGLEKLRNFYFGG